MADNYLEKKYESYLERKEAEKRAKCRIWRKRLDEYRKRIETEQDSRKENMENNR